MITAFPIWILAIDYLLGIIMWTLIGRFGMSLFLNEDSNFFFMKIFVKVTDPLLKLFNKITPSFLIYRLRPLYVAWFIYMVRFYVIPLSLGYGVMGVLSLPLESEISLAIYDLLLLLTTKVE
tara:strand:- start:234 stop:599 length:366 start_codon:yes stop_codon:yes gene_type:complete